jgi:cyclopropane fatty-acyl-phospholipid synthase-like methyltransferase
MFNCSHFIEEFKDYVKKLGVKSALEVGCLSGELKDAVGADGIDTDPQRDDVIKADIRTFKPKKKYDLVFSSGLLEHYAKEEAVEIIKAMAGTVRKGGYVLSYVPNSGCIAYKNAKAKTTTPWKDELDYTAEELAELHEQAELEMVDKGLAGKEWAKRFGPEESEPYLCYVLARK